MTEITFTKRQRDGIRWPKDARDLAVSAAITAALGLIAAISGPFGTFYDLDLPARLGYWLASFMAGWLITIGAVLFLLPLIMARGVTPTVGGAIAGGVGAVPLTLIVLAAESAYRPTVPLPSLPELYAYVAMISVPISTGLTWMSWHRTLRVTPPTQTDPAPPSAPFLTRIPARLGSDLLALAAEDHYVRIHTALGSDLVLMRLTDAANELQGVDGLRVHRSYWVARSAVAAADRAGRRLTLTLKNGMQIPVSRTYAATLEERGWLAD